ncbi:MAG: hypothetical protein QXJ14_03280 [Candidatus Aenigmatarchaeota archaeon]
MDFNNLYLVKGKLNYKGKDYIFRTLKLVRLKDLSEYKPVDIQVFTQFDPEKVYIFDDRYNQFLDFDNEYAISIPERRFFSIYTLNPIYALVSTSENTSPVILNVLSKSNFAYEIQASKPYVQRYLITIYKYAFLKFITATKDTLPIDFSLIFYNYDIYLPYTIINQYQTFDWDIIEL